MLNYYYPVVIISNISSIQPYTYGFYNNTLYYNNGKSIVVIDQQNLLIYDGKNIYQLRDTCLTKLCYNGLLYNMLSKKWTFMVSKEDNCCCITTIDETITNDANSNFSLVGHIDQSIQKYNDFSPSVSWCNSAPYLNNNFTRSFIIRNLAGSPSNVYGLLSSDNIYYLSLQDDPSNGVVDDSVKLLPNSSYSININVNMTYSFDNAGQTYINNVIKIFFCTYCLKFNTDASSNIVNQYGPLGNSSSCNNQAVFYDNYSLTGPVDAGNGFSLTFPQSGMTIFIFVDQPQAGSIKIALLRMLNNVDPSVDPIHLTGDAYLDIKITKMQ
jgi:hypothetical protein